MAEARDIRRCALQALYQLDAHRDAGDSLASDVMLESLEDSIGDHETHRLGVALAQRAWICRDTSDQAVAKLALDWPTHRQPMVDRNILRLAVYEITSGETPPKVAINEAIELAREFSTDKSPAFINGILDKVMKAWTKTTNSPAGSKEVS